MNYFKDKKVYYGDLHNHCAISYAHGSLEEAIANAKEQLDFVSITGHAHWPDMPEANERIQYIIDFHIEGFEKLKKNWGSMLSTISEHSKDGEFVLYPGFEIHFNSVGDRTICYKDLEGEILYADSQDELHERLRELRQSGKDSISFPHHIGYRQGTRGIDWKTYSNEFAPVLEFLSMHGCSETSENTRPFLHTMGPSDWESTVQYGLAQGHVFGFIGNTDHHSGHPGSYGHGVTGVWSKDLSRDSIWESIYQRRTYALTGDRMDLEFSLNNQPMGSVIELAKEREISIDLRAGGAIDHVDILKNNKIVKRFSQCDVEEKEITGRFQTKIYLELGWGERNKEIEWDAEISIENGNVLDVEPRFRGYEVVSPVEKAGKKVDYYFSKITETSDKCVKFVTKTYGNANNSTVSTQGVSVDCEVSMDSVVVLKLNGQTFEVPVSRLIAGAKTGHLADIDSPAFRLNRIPLPHELNWSLQWKDTDDKGSFYYVRVKQTNDQWAWSSPIWIK